MNEKFWQDRTDRIMVGIEWERKYEAREWISKIPFIPFKENWSVKVIPPFAGAVVRFLVSLKGQEKEYVSVYLDCYGQLGAWDVPYWEVFPYENGDTYRCEMNEVDKLVEAIDCSLKALNENND